MDIAILYHSGTGNTRLVARQIARGLDARKATCRVHDIVESPPKDCDDFWAGVLASHSAVGFGSPVHAWKPTAVMTDFIRNLPGQPDKPAFVFCSHAGQPANTLLLLSRELQQKGFQVIAGHAVTAEEDWPVARVLTRTPPNVGRPDQRDLLALDEFVAKLYSLIDRAVGGETVSPAAFPFQRSWMHCLGQVVTPSRLRMGMGKKRADPDLCTRCGVCARGCPVGAIRLEPYPVFDRHCVGCWACYHACPEAAIDTWLLFGRDGRYAGPKLADGE